MLQFNFGGIIRELREAIKDVWYRNRMESAERRLGVIRLKLELARKYQVSVDSLESGDRRDSRQDVVSELKRLV